MAIEEATKADRSPEASEQVILDLYGPKGAAYAVLQAELRDAPLLEERQREVAEVLASLAEGRNYVAVCGALPLVEFVLSKAAGRWQQPPRHRLGDRLDDGALSDEQETDLLVHAAAVEMVTSEIPEVWGHRKMEVGAVTDELNRHLVLHGSGVGWDEPGNATRAVLLLAAACRVAGPLLGPPERAAL